MTKRCLSILCVVTLMGVLYGCGGSQVAPTEIAAPASDEILVWSSKPERPGWVDKEPEVKDGIMYFVGLSGVYRTEKSGRKDARRSAINNVVLYLGTLAKIKFEEGEKTFGLDGDVIDPTVSSRAFEKQLAVNMARRVKNDEWYSEKWQKPTGTGYKVFLLAKVPQSEINRTMKDTAGGLAKKAEQLAKEAGDEVARKQAEKASAFWKQMEQDGLVE